MSVDVVTKVNFTKGLVISENIISDFVSAYDNKTRLQEHIDGEHLNKNPFKCPHCTKKWPSNRKLQAHIKARYVFK